MAKPENLYIASVLAMKIDDSFVREDIDGAVVYRPRPEVTNPPGEPIRFSSAIVKLIASDDVRAHRLAMRFARLIFPPAEGWGSHGSSETLLLRNVQTFQRGDG